MKKHRNITMPQWIKEAVRENGFVAAVVGLSTQARYGKARFFELLAHGLYNRCKLDIEKRSTTRPPLSSSPPRRKKSRRALAAVSLLALSLCVNACSVPTLTPANGVPCLPTTTPGTLLDDNQSRWVRSEEQVRQYTVNPYRDPNNPNLRHDAHNVQRLEEAAVWDLRPNPPLSSGAAPERTVPATVLNPIKAELEQKLAEQQKYMALIIEQNEQLLQQDAARRQQAEEMNELRLQTDDALNQIGSLRNQLEVERQLREQPDGDAARPWWKFWNH
ncbi:MAG: hypothetical protein LBD30_00770 [Verrucomicrobiales bacterium]|jgi:hypothetical protein|nr:hypothetical protein [Verrucomicrobiales bacterium]